MKLLVGDVLKTKDGEFIVKKILSRNRYMVKKIAKEQEAGKRISTSNRIR